MNGDAENGFLCWLAVVCSSFVAVNLATSKRSPACPYGDVRLPHVKLGNCLLSRSILVAMVCTCLGATWVLEQPGSSVLPWFPRFEALLVNAYLRIYSAGWWARLYQALTPKRHKAWANCSLVGMLDRGVLRKKDRDACFVKTTDKRKRGDKVTFSGNRNLKKTQPLVCLCIQHFRRFNCFPICFYM